ncbi:MULTISPECIES: sigma 54-interacting transcriptional regulator [unclassified Novosphingobium]|uniref:sigma-54 interaction domain-containing protein n=1 Tax=unclassified Novosphingobium TaxID=2644732 RepID=UPI000EC3FD53|nr:MULTISPECIES: sigma 54-interacting transcriptional regulator [unclassified Novosphingobium]HCF24407.1 sigma-54-dependent Fis family transcriptional regulator [Novosphingobium sp.]HQV03788.1 sigma 54-interacting transcriptional regulator [Novosphingobium sp.]
MSGLAASENVARANAPLVQRAAAILGSATGSSNAVLRGKGDPVPPGPGPSVLLERGAANQLRREGQRGQFTLSYRDPVGDAPLAALLAALTQPGMPIAADPETLSILALADRLAASEIPVLINGPTGTGKEVLSRFIHARSPRKDKPFVAVNCAAMPEAMLEALLFGHKKGAFTGASEANEGFFRAADGGTLLLDEIAEMPLSLQAKLLRALQEGEVVPIGATQAIKVDVRVIACANRDLPTEVAEGRFRADLFYRLNVFPLALRPLRERVEDIAPLAFALVLRHTAPGKPIPWISDAALAMLKLHGWPGNVRELENVVRRALLLADGAGEIGAGHIVFDQPARLVSEPAGQMVEPTASRLSNIVQISEAKAIMQTLDACGGSRIEAARALGISERTLRYRLAAFREAGLAVAGARR